MAENKACESYNEICGGETMASGCGENVMKRNAMASRLMASQLQCRRRNISAKLMAAINRRNRNGSIETMAIMRTILKAKRMAYRKQYAAERKLKLSIRLAAIYWRNAMKMRKQPTWRKPAAENES